MVIGKQAKLTIGSSVAAVVLVLFTKFFFNMPIERAVLLAPVIVVSAAVVAGLVIFWCKVGISHWRGDDDPDELPTRK